MTGSTTTDWISAISTAVLGGLGVFITVWQWTASGFRPRLTARVEAARNAMELKIVNKGRATGIIDRIVVVKAGRMREKVRVDARFESFPGGKFQALALPGLAQIKIMIEAEQDNPFPQNVELKIELGRGKDRYLSPVVDSEVSLFGLKSVLPPGTFSRQQS
jgi:RecB family exonuclease